ncbi:MAG: PHB depolymerase family esterase [Polyangiaceae bacterium]|nr:PHB depolymerase family esterase [Polyangiaceae bacterium]
MARHRHRVLAGASISLGLLVADPLWAAALTQVDRSTWGASGVPSYVTMYIYAPDKRIENPPIVVACHSCGTAVSGYINSISGIVSGADRYGFILILPEATGRNCWDVGSSQSLTHDGGGDTQAIAQMVKYALTQYGGDPDRVYAMGGSSGAMMTQALMAVYPDVFRAGSARAGVPAGCWADGYDSGQQWSNNCAGGRTTKTDQQWGDLVRGMYRDYDGPRPRIQLFHGTADTTINYNNMGEAIKEWTNVLGLGTSPTSTDSHTTANSTYARQFWENDCGYTVFETWAGQNGSHSMPYEQDSILTYFGLDEPEAPDPVPTTCSGTGGSAGTGGEGAVSSGGTTGGVGGLTGGVGPTMGGIGGATTGGFGGIGGHSTGGMSTGGVSTGGVSTGGITGTGGLMTGGTPTSGTNTGGIMMGTGGLMTGGTATGGMSTGGVTGTGGTSTSGGATGTGATPTCTAPLQPCGSTCVDLQNNSANCGACSHVCEGTEVCSLGVCAANCTSGYTRCGTTCVDLMTSTTSCGRCDSPCLEGQVCWNGTCSSGSTAAPEESDCTCRVGPGRGAHSAGMLAGWLALTLLMATRRRTRGSNPSAA